MHHLKSYYFVKLKYYCLTRNSKILYLLNSWFIYNVKACINLNQYFFLKEVSFIRIQKQHEISIEQTNQQIPPWMPWNRFVIFLAMYNFLFFCYSDNSFLWCQTPNSYEYFKKLLIKCCINIYYHLLISADDFFYQQKISFLHFTF